MMRELLGVDDQERATYQRYMSLVHPDDRGWVDELWQQLAMNRKPVECEHRIIRADGLVRGGTGEDAPGRGPAETRMKLSSQRFTDLVAVTPVGIGLFDEAERLVDANDALCDLLGIDLEQLRGMTASSLTHPDEPVGWLSSAARLTAEREGGFKVPQRILLRPDGEL